MARGEKVSPILRDDLIIKGVPMVDQGDRAYCVAASVERVLQLQGTFVEQATLAKEMKIDPRKGINLEDALQRLRPLLAGRDVKIRVLYAWNPEMFADLMREYNRIARRRDIPEVSFGTSVIDVGQCLNHVNPEAFRQARLRDKNIRYFKGDVEKEIKAGRPLIWSVRLGLFPEQTKPVYFGGHMRLIIGINSRTEEIIYSDSWGKGHEYKRMDIQDAWAITAGLLLVAGKR